MCTGFTKVSIPLSVGNFYEKCWKYKCVFLKVQITYVKKGGEKKNTLYTQVKKSVCSEALEAVLFIGPLYPGA